MLQIACVHLTNGFSCNAFVIDGHSVPSRFGLFFLPAIEAAKAAMIVVAEPPEVIECGHFQVWTGECVRQFFPDGIENADARLLFDTFREKFLGSCGSLLLGGLIPRFARMDGTFLVAAHMDERSRL